MAWAIVIDRRIENIILYDGVSDYTPPAGALEQVPAQAQVGWERVNGAWKPPGDVPALSVPREVSRSQGLIALDALGLLDAVETIVASAARPVQIAWANEPMFSRDSPAINALWAALGKSQAELDALFIQAAAIRV